VVPLLYLLSGVNGLSKPECHDDELFFALMEDRNITCMKIRENKEKNICEESTVVPSDDGLLKFRSIKKFCPMSCGECKGHKAPKDELPPKHRPAAAVRFYLGIKMVSSSNRNKVAGLIRSTTKAAVQSSYERWSGRVTGTGGGTYRKMTNGVGGEDIILDAPCPAEAVSKDTSGTECFILESTLKFPEVKGSNKWDILLDNYQKYSNSEDSFYSYAIDSETDTQEANTGTRKQQNLQSTVSYTEQIEVFKADVLTEVRFAVRDQKYTTDDRIDEVFWLDTEFGKPSQAGNQWDLRSFQAIKASDTTEDSMQNGGKITLLGGVFIVLICLSVILSGLLLIARSWQFRNTGVKVDLDEKNMWAKIADDFTINVDELNEPNCSSSMLDVTDLSIDYNHDDGEGIEVELEK